MKALKIATIILSILSFVALWLFGPRIIRINNITCTNQFGKCSNLVIGELERIETTHLLETKSKVNEVLQQSVLVSEHSLHYQFPETLEVNLIERKPRFALTNRAKNSALIDKSGLVLSYGDSVTIPRVIVANSLPNVGSTVESRQLFALEIVYDLNSLYQVNSGEIVDGSLVIEFDSGTNVLFPLEGDRETLVGSLVLIKSKSDAVGGNETENINIKTIDLRYRNPVLRYDQSK